MGFDIKLGLTAIALGVTSGCCTVDLLIGRSVPDATQPIRLGVERAEVIQELGFPDAQFFSKEQIDVYELETDRGPQPLAALMFLPFDIITFGTVYISTIGAEGPQYRLHFRYDNFDRLISVEPGDGSDVAHQVAHRINAGIKTNAMSEAMPYEPESIRAPMERADRVAAKP